MIRVVYHLTEAEEEEEEEKEGEEEEEVVSDSRYSCTIV